MENPEIMGFEIAAMVVGIVQMVKNFFNLEGKAAMGVAFGVAMILFGYWSAQQAGVLSDSVVLYVSIFLRTVGYSITVPGLFSVVKNEFIERIAARSL